MPYKKLALKRDPSVPVGQKSPMHLDCPCGRQVPVDGPVNECECGAKYNRRGYVITDTSGYASYLRALDGRGELAILPRNKESLLTCDPFLAALQNFYDATSQLSRVGALVQDKDHHPIRTCEKYPFQDNFDKLATNILTWLDAALTKAEEDVNDYSIQCENCDWLVRTPSDSLGKARADQLYAAHLSDHGREPAQW